MSECQTKAGNQECFEKLEKLSLSLLSQRSLSHSLSLDMLNNFYFHVYAQNSLFICENVNEFFFYHIIFFDKTFHSWVILDHIITRSCEWTVNRAGSQIKMLSYSKSTHKGWFIKKQSFQKIKIAFTWERLVLGGCPFHSLVSSWVHQTVRRTASQD